MKARGFSLVEIMVAMGILALLVSFAVPNFLRARSNTAELLAITSTHTVGKACQNFYSQGQPRSYPDSLAALSTSNPPYIDSVLGSGQKQGYQFAYTFQDAEHFQLQAQPVIPGINGNRFFFLDQTGVLRARQGGPAGPGDNPVE